MHVISRIERLKPAMNGKSLHRNRRVLLFAFIIGPILIAVILFIVSRQMYAEQQQAMKLVKQSNEDRAQLIELHDALNAAEAGEYGFLLTGSQSWLPTYLLSLNDTMIRLTFLAASFADRPAQLDRLNRLRSLVEEKLAEFRDVTRLKQSGQDEKAIQLVSANGGVSALNQVRSLIAEMQSVEDQTLAERLQENETKVNVRDAISTGLLCLSAVVVAGAGVLLLRIRQLQSIITICAWTQRVNFNGKWMRMEDFLWQRFRVRVSHGISEEAFEGVMGMVGKNFTVSDNRPDKKVENPTTQPDADSRN
jgi:CHASE3 domain sensor protein